MGKTSEAYMVIKNKILEGELLPLADISEDELQSELSLSRTPVHEALQLLEKEGFVNIYPRKGTIVSEMTLDLIFGVYEARELNEPYITRHACSILPDAWLGQMKKEYEDFLTNEQNFTDVGARRHYIELDRELHGKILETCRNTFLRGMMANIYDHSHRLRVRTDRQNKRYDLSINEHLDIINALLARDPDAAEQAALEHVIRAKETAFKYY